MALCAAIHVALMNARLVRSDTLLRVITMGIVITSCQTLAVFNAFSVNFAEPFRSLIAVFALFSLDLEIVNYECVVGQNSLNKYVANFVALPAFIFVFTVAFGVFNCCSFDEGGEASNKQVITQNLVGLVLGCLDAGVCK